MIESNKNIRYWQLISDLEKLTRHLGIACRSENQIKAEIKNTILAIEKIESELKELQDGK